MYKALLKWRFAGGNSYAKSNYIVGSMLVLVDIFRAIDQRNAAILFKCKTNLEILLTWEGTQIVDIEI